MAFLHLDMSLVRLIFRPFLRRSALTTPFNHNFGLPRDVDPSALKLILVVWVVSSCQCKWPNSLSILHLRRSSIWWIHPRWILLRSSVECFCPILTLHKKWIIAWSHLLICDKSSGDRGQVSLTYRRILLTQAWNTFPQINLYLWVLLEVRKEPSKLIQ